MDLHYNFRPETISVCRSHFSPVCLIKYTFFLSNPVCSRLEWIQVSIHYDSTISIRSENFILSMMLLSISPWPYKNLTNSCLYCCAYQVKIESHYNHVYNYHNYTSHSVYIIMKGIIHALLVKLKKLSSLVLIMLLTCEYSSLSYLFQMA